MPVDWIARAEALSLDTRNFVDGRLQVSAGGAILDKLSPRNGQLLYQIRASDAADVHAAVLAARCAFEDGRWSKLPVQRRKDVLSRLASLIDENREELALLESIDVGKPIRDALSFDVPAAAARIRYNAEASDKYTGNVYGADQSSLSYQLYRPIGVVAGIIGWNFPLVLATEKIGPALAAGNCVVLKPSELTCLTATRLAELAREAGVPDGVFNVICGNAEVGAALSHHRDVNLISFTGSSQTGKQLLVAAGKSNMKRLVLECGGKAPNIVFEDCPDIPAVVDAILARAFWNQGQVCTASSRLLLHQGIAEQLM
jgi:acyl-CoA reductase-like NAD-dependent aldehyde dehydrogenase